MDAKTNWSPIKRRSFPMAVYSAKAMEQGEIGACIRAEAQESAKKHSELIVKGLCWTEELGRKSIKKGSI